MRKLHCVTSVEVLSFGSQCIGVHTPLVRYRKRRILVQTLPFGTSHHYHPFIGNHFDRLVLPMHDGKPPGPLSEVQCLSGTWF